MAHTAQMFICGRDHCLASRTAHCLHRRPPADTCPPTGGEVAFESRADFPESVRERLPPHAQDICKYKESFNSAWDQYG